MATSSASLAPGVRQMCAPTGGPDEARSAPVYGRTAGGSRPIVLKAASPLGSRAGCAAPHRSVPPIVAHANPPRPMPVTHGQQTRRRTGQGRSTPSALPASSAADQCRPRPADRRRVSAYLATNGGWSASRVQRTSIVRWCPVTCFGCSLSIRPTPPRHAETSASNIPGRCLASKRIRTVFETVVIMDDGHPGEPSRRESPPGAGHAGHSTPSGRFAGSGPSQSAVAATSPAPDRSCSVLHVEMSPRRGPVRAVVPGTRFPRLVESSDVE